MSQINLNIPLIRDGGCKEFASYLDELKQSQPDVNICQSLFEAVDQEYLPPRIFSVFLSWSLCLNTIALCIQHGPSRSIRKQGIKQFGKALAGPEQWEPAWRAVGGTKGLVDLFAKISVTEVKALARAIGCCNRGQHKVGAREKAIEELLHALLPSHYPGSKFQTHDKRPIKDHYAQMVPACSLEFVDQLLDAKDQSNPLYRQLPATRLIKTHGELLQKRVIEDISGDGYGDGHLHQYLGAFVYSEPPRPGPDSKVSASMAFATKVLQFRLGDIDDDKRWPSMISEADVLFSLLRRSIRRKLPEAKLHDVIMLGLQLLEAKPKLKPAFKSKHIWSKLITRWKKAPELYEDSLALALRLKLSGSQETIGRDFFQTSRTMQVKPELRWPLLRLYCLHVPKQGVDLDTVDNFKPLAKQPWPIDIFYQLSKDHAVRLLKGLYNANPKYSFLQGPAGVSILSIQDIISQQNFNVVLLLTVLQRNSQEIQRRAEGAVDELRKKAATAREQSDRAQLAKAASAYAIASGSLDLYGETVTWQQRYVRDPLTVKVVFGRDAVMTSEGIELLSGIPQPLPEDMTLAEVASRVEKANEILKTFHESRRIAKREPSFHQSDWAGVKSMFGAAISHRVTRAEDLQKRLRGPEADVYTAIWSGTLAMLEEVSVDFLKEAYGPIKNLLDTLPPTALAATTKAMLEGGNERRRKQDRQSGDDILERLSYEVLLRLAKSEKPELAQQFVLRTILDRPDASSWHRRLLSISFMKCLTAKDAHQMLLAFATAIGEKLEEQSYVRVGEAQPPQWKPSLSLVKVTTVKYLAQLLDNAEFISADAAVEVLVELFKAGTHRDIRLATLDSLLSLLNNLCSGADENWRSNALVEKIMEALETVIPVVGSVNERRPPRQEDWKEARKSGTLPDISDISVGLPPLLSALLTAPDAPQYPGLKNLRAEFVARFVLPVLWHSQAEHQKWVALFLAKHQVNLAVDDLPPTPITPRVWDTLVGRYRELIPETVLEDFNKHIVMTIAPPAALKGFNRLLRKNTDLCNTPEVQHWLSVFGQSMDQYVSSGTHLLVRMIHDGWPIPSVRNGISFSRVQEIVIAHASLFLDEYENYTDIWNDFVNDLRPPAKITSQVKDADLIRSMVSTWQKAGRLILEKVVALVLDKKKKHTLEHKRSILPSMVKLRLWLLPYPCFSVTAEVDHQCKVFVKEMEKLMDTFLTGEANVLRWPQIAKDALTVSKLLNTAEERLCVALYIGKLMGSSDRAGDQRSSALNLVRIALAMKLVEDGREGLKETSKHASLEDLVRRLQKMIEEWQTHFDEGIREKVADWRREQKDLCKILMSRESDMDR